MERKTTFHLNDSLVFVVVLFLLIQTWKQKQTTTTTTKHRKSDERLFCLGGAQCSVSQMVGDGVSFQNRVAMFIN